MGRGDEALRSYRDALDRSEGAPEVATAFARFLADPPDKGGLGCRDALNLDGGPSTQLVAKLPTLALSEPRGWGVPNALVVVPGGN